MVSVPLEQMAWNESDHPRDANGKFSESSGGGAGGSGKDILDNMGIFSLAPYTGSKDQLKKLLGGVKPERFLNLMNADKFVSAFKTGPDTLEVKTDTTNRGDMKDESRRMKWKRTFDLAKKVVTHDYFMVEEKGKGLGKEVLGDQAKLYQELGMKGIRIAEAVSVGSYAWAKYGFKPTAEGWSDLAGRVKADLPSSGLADDTKAAVGKVLDSKEPEALWVLSDIPEAGPKLLKDKSWAGDLNFDDKRAMERFHSYVKRR